MSHSFAEFYRGKRVLVTGHTGFEGGWTVAWLKLMGAQVCGYGLPPAARPNFFDATILDRGMTSVFGDIRDRNSLANTFTELQPEIVIHCAAQTSPQSSLQEPVDAFSTNVMGTVHILEEARLTHSVRAVVLMNCGCECEVHPARDSDGIRPNELLSASMASSELARSAFNKAFFQKTGTAVATARTAAAMGGGDWRKGHIVPELVRAIISSQPLPASKEKEGKLRIWHVLEPVQACLLLAKTLFERGQKSAGVWDFAPSNEAGISASELNEKFTTLWNAEGAATPKNSSKSPAAKSSSNKTQSELGWVSLLSSDEALAWTVDWYRGFCSEPSSTSGITENQLEEYTRLIGQVVLA